MYTVIIVTVIMMFVGAYLLHSSIGYFAGKSDYIAGGLLGIIAGGICGILLAVVLGFGMDRHPDPVKTELVALKNVNGLEGNFFLLFGSINDEYKYSYWYPDGSGGYKHGIMEDSESITVFEDEGLEFPYLQENMLKCDVYVTNWAYCTDRSEGFEFHIPPGSIVREFNLQ